MATAVARVGKKKFSPYFAGGGLVSTLYNVFCILIVTLTVNYLVIPFQVTCGGIRLASPVSVLARGR